MCPSQAEEAQLETEVTQKNQEVKKIQAMVTAKLAAFHKEKEAAEKEEKKDEKAAAAAHAQLVSFGSRFFKRYSFIH